MEALKNTYLIMPVSLAQKSDLIVWAELFYRELPYQELMVCLNTVGSDL